MALRVNALKLCSERDRLLIAGYIRETQKRLPVRSIISDLIRYVILSFYWHRDTFNERACGECLEIYNNDQSIWKYEANSDHSLCLIGDLVTPSMCRKFTISIRTQCESKWWCPYIGYFVVSSIDEINDWSMAPGLLSNSGNSESVLLHSGNSKSDFGRRNLDCGDDMKMVFIFTNTGKSEGVRCRCTFYDVSENSVARKVEGVIPSNMGVWPAVSLYFKNEELAIASYELIKRQ